MLMSPLLIFAAGLFEDPAFAARETIAALGLDLFEDFVDRFVGILRRLGVVDFELRLGLQPFEHCAAGNESLKTHSRLEIQQSEKRATEMRGECHVGTICAMV